MATLYVLANPTLLLHPNRLLNPSVQDRKQIERICAFLGNSEGRDKIGKFIQFFARFVDGFLREGPGQNILAILGKDGKSIHSFCDQLRNLWNGLQTARGWSWLGKSIIEWKTDIQTYENVKLEKEVKFLHMACRFFFAGRWFWENFFLLTASKVLLDKSKGGFMPLPADMNRWAKKSWGFALICGILTEVAKLRLIAKKRSEIEDRYGSSAVSLEEYNKEISRQKEDLRLRVRTIAMMLFDSPVSLAVGWGWKISHMTLGASMTCASIIQCQNLWPK